MIHEFVMVDIETLGTPRECKTNFIAMPSAAFIVWNGFKELPLIFNFEFNVQDQLDKGAAVNARTIAFWMGEALRGSTAAQRIINTLEMSDLDWRVDSYSGIDFVPLTGTDGGEDIYKAIHEVLALYGKIPYYGNGPEFDLSIFESVSANCSNHTLKTPWSFNRSSSVRTLKELYRDDGSDYDALMQESFVYAEKVMEETGFLGTGHTPVKHNPVFDALAEAFVVAKIKKYFLEK